MKDVFAIQDEITLAIVEKLKPRLFREEKAKLANRQTVDLEAYNLYLKGRYFWGKTTLEGLEKAVEYFEKTIEKDPSYALAYAGLADAEMYRSFWGGCPPKETYPKARAAALKALEIDDTLAEAITSLARIKHSYDWDWDGAERGYRQAIDFNPGYATAHQYYALCLMHQGRFEQAVKEMERAHELDPFSLHINVNVGQVYLYARDYDAAITSFRKTIEMDPDHPTTHLFLGFAYLGKSMYEEAMAELQKEKKLAKCWRPGIEIALGGCHSLMGQKDTTRLVLNELLKQSKQQYIPPYLLALLYFALEEDDHGFEWLNKAYETHDSFLYYLKIEPTFDTRRSDPRYIAMLKKMGLDK
jgi:tetratricopeptide (TPR) repeat protein